MDIFNLRGNAIALIAEQSKDKILAVIEFAIIDLQNFLNVTRTINEHQIKETAQFVLRKYGFLTIPDIKLVFDRIKAGQYKLYEGLDGQKICMAFEEWVKERDMAADEMNYQNHVSVTERREPKSFYEENKEPYSMREIADEKWFKKKTL